MENVGSIEINRPIDDVFRAAVDYMPEWSLIVVEDEIIEPSPGVVGSTFRTVTEDKGNRMVFQGVVTQYDPPHVNAVHLSGDMFNIDTEFQFEDLGGRTKVTQFAKVTGKGAFKFILWCMGWLMKKSHCQATMRELESLKRYCESGVRTDAQA